MINDNKFNFVVELIKKRKRTLSNLVWRGSKVGISEKEIAECVEVLFDLGAIVPTEEMIGDGWNSRQKAIYYNWKAV